MPPSKGSPHQLMVEGKNDVHVIATLVTRHGFDFDTDVRLPYIKAAEGDDPLLKIMPIMLKAQYQTAGFVFDADEDLKSRWEQVRSKIDAEGYKTPVKLPGSGLILDHPEKGKRPRIGVWIMPDNNDPGKLEDFLLTLVPTNDTSIGYARQATRYAKKVKSAPFRKVSQLKAVLHTWLAWREPPGMPYGTAITAQVLKHNSSEAKRFVAWFCDLYELN